MRGLLLLSLTLLVYFSPNFHHFFWSPSQGRKIFVEAGGPKATTAAFFELLAAKLQSRTPGGPRIWVVLDDFPTIGKIPGLCFLAAVGRRCGVPLVLAAQNYGQVSRVYGEDEGYSIAGSAGTSFYFAAEQRTAERVAASFGGYKAVSISESRQHEGGPVLVGEAWSTKPAIYPSEVMGLHNFECFISVPGYKPCRTFIRVAPGKEAPHA